MLNIRGSQSFHTHYPFEGHILLFKPTLGTQKHSGTHVQPTITVCIFPSTVNAQNYALLLSDTLDVF